MKNPFQIRDVRDISRRELRKYNKQIDKLNKKTALIHEQPKKVFDQPKPEKKQDIIFNALLNGKRLTVLDAWELAHTTELRSCRCALERKYGVRIMSQKKPGVNYFEYWLPQEEINLFKKRL